MEDESGDGVTEARPFALVSRGGGSGGGGGGRPGDARARLRSDRAEA